MARAPISGFLDWASAHAGSDKGINQYQYLLGTNGQLLTATLLNAKAKANYPDAYAAVISRLTPHIGQYVTDCNGLAEWYLRLTLGGNHDTLSRYNYRDWCAGNNGTDMQIMPQFPGCAVFQAYASGTIHHVGFCWKKYGPGPLDWYVIQAAGYRLGVIVSKLAGNPAWNRWGLMMLKFDYDVPAEGLTPVTLPNPATMPVLRLKTPNMKGTAVTLMQRRLQAHGFGKDFIESGIGTFGPRTDKAVRQFQQAKGLVIDGICGIRTWTGLLK